MKNQIKKQDWFKITRKNGLIQYALKIDNSFYLNGFGFAIKNFDCISIEQIESIPNELKIGIASFDGDKKTNLKAICNPNDLWNGWHKPYIHTTSIKKLCKILSLDGYMNCQMNFGQLQILTFCDGKIENESIIEPSVINGEIYYYLGNEGFVFDFKQTKK